MRTGVWTMAAGWMVFSCVDAAETTRKDDTSSAKESRETREEVIVHGVVPATEPTLQTRELMTVPGTLGDPLQAIYSLPGVVQTNEVGGSPAVRGSGPGDNAFLVDFLPVSYVFHDFGNSIFEESLIRDFGLTSAGYGPRFGKATGAVFDISLRAPRQQPVSYTLESSALRLGLLAEGRVSDTQAFYAAYRESLVHLILPLVEDKEQEQKDDTRFSRYPRSRDYALKYQWQLDEHNLLTVSSLGAQDSVAVNYGANSDEALIDPGSTGNTSINTRFANAGVVWDASYGAHHLKTAVGFLHASRRDRLGNGNEFLDLNQPQWTFKSQYDWQTNDWSSFATGVELQRDIYRYHVHARYRSCTIFSPDCQTNHGEFVDATDRINFDTGAMFIEETLRPVTKLALTLGGRATRQRYLQETHIEPRTALSWQWSDSWKSHASWGQYHQAPEVIQMVPVFGNTRLSSPRATHYVLGGEYRSAGQQAKQKSWRVTLDAYYKSLHKLVVDVTDGSQYANQAHGHAYGAELMLRRERQDAEQRWSGWMTLAWSRTQRTNDLTKQEMRFDFDTPWVINVVADYRITAGWTVGARWNFRSGYPYTPIIGNQPNPDFPGYYLPLYGDLNSERAGPITALICVPRKRLPWADCMAAIFSTSSMPMLTRMVARWCTSPWQALMNIGWRMRKVCH